MAVKLPRLPTNWQNQPQLLERYWDLAMTNIEDLLTQILELPVIKEAIEEAQAAADTAHTVANAAQTSAIAAQAAAVSAQTTANGAGAVAGTTNRETSIVNSYVTGWVGDLISSDSSGFITIAPHQRVYGDQVTNPTVPIDGGTLSTGAAIGSVIRVYYVDPTRSGGAVSYAYTIDPSAAPVQTGDTHSVGAVTVPAAGSLGGAAIKGPGFVTEIPT